MKIGKLQIFWNRPLKWDGEYPWHHGEAADPTKWNWWKRFHISFCWLDPDPDKASAFRMWIYTRSKAQDIDFYWVKNNAANNN